MKKHRQSKHNHLKELTSLTVINIVDNESDGMSSPCACMTPIPNHSNSAAQEEEDNRVATYTMELATRLNEDQALDMENLCTAAHGLSLLLIGEYEEDNNEELEVSSSSPHEKSEPESSGQTPTNHPGIRSPAPTKNNSNSHSPMTRKPTKKKYLLFDGGPDPKIWSNNAAKCKIPLHEINNVVLSHYHVDHSNGLRAAVREISKQRIDEGKQDSVPVHVDLHHSQIETRGFKVRGKIYPMKPPNPIAKDFEEMGAKVSLHKKGHVLDDCFYVSGEITRQTKYESGLPAHFNQIDSKHGKQWVPDELIQDERYVACKIRGRGVVVFSACSHAGIVNVCKDVTDRLDSKLTAAVGGFHLAGSAVEGRIEETVKDLKELGPDLLLAGHCTGWRAKSKLAEEFPYNFQPLSVGGVYKFNSM